MALAGFATAVLMLVVGSGLVAWASVVPFGSHFRDGPPVGHTGGFGEPTCLACHFAWPDDESRGSVQLTDLPQSFAPDSTYQIGVLVQAAELGAVGFQLAIRDSAGRQYGRLVLRGAGVQIVTSPVGVEYASHTATGATPSSTDSTRWIVGWRTPPVAHSPAVISVAANAANGDNSALDDQIYTTSASVAPTPAQR